MSRKYRTFVALYILCLCLFVALPGNVHSQPAGGVIVAEGMAPIGDDKGLARDIAILRAKQTAIEEMGVGVSRETIVDMGVLMDDIIKIQTFALVTAYDILSEEEKGDQYTVTIRAQVVPKEEERPVLENLFAHCSLILHSQGDGSRIIRKALVKRLIEEGFFVLDPGFSQWSPEYVLKIDSDLILTQEISDIESYRADCEIRLVSSSTGKVLVSEAAPQEKRVFGLTEEQALNSADANGFSATIVFPLISAFMRKFHTIAHMKEHDVEVVVKGMPDHRMFREEFCRMISALRLGVKKVSNERFDEGVGTVTVRYAEKTDYLAAMIGFRSRYRIARVTRDRIDVRYWAPSISPDANDTLWESFDRLTEEGWDQETFHDDDQWDQFEKGQQEDWQGFRADVERTWDTFVDSTKKTWVDYGKGLDVRSEVDFEQGIIKITAIVPADAENVRGEGIDRIAGQARRIFSTDNPANIEVFKDQVYDDKGIPVTFENVERYFSDVIAPDVRVDETAYRAKDGVQRRKVTAKIHLVPNNLRVRAARYLPAVNKQAGRFKVMPQLILAVIHTESYFNPFARSSCGALGLMQLIPRHGAREAYHFIYRKDRILPPEYLYDPENNIELGAAYLALLERKHFRQVRDMEKNRYLTICGYNWGPDAINQNIIGRHQIHQMSSEALYTLLRQKTPQETRDYLQKVTERMKIYDNFY